MNRSELRVDWAAGEITADELRIPGSDGIGPLLIVATKEALFEGGAGRDDDYLVRHSGLQGIVEAAAIVALAEGSIANVDGERHVLIQSRHFPR